MKSLIPFSATLIVLALFTGTVLPAQVIFSRFDFNAIPYTTATIVPNATAIDADATDDGAAVFIDANCGALKGIDLSIPRPFPPQIASTYSARVAGDVGITLLDATECWIYQHGLRHMGEIELARGLVGLGGMTS